jgi:hypothetical protein
LPTAYAREPVCPRHTKKHTTKQTINYTTIFIINYKL